MKFPKNFYFGGATAANQFEGGWNEGGKGPSIADHMTLGSRKEPRLFTEKIDESLIYPSHKGSDFYHHYKEDIKLLAELGLNMFRMSINWSRIYPNGNDELPNQEGIEFYRDVFSELKKNHIEPLVTLSHYELPYHLSEIQDGWYSRKTVDCYVKYVNTVFHEYKDLVTYWLTFNELNASIFEGNGYFSNGMLSAESKNQDAGVLNKEKKEISLNDLRKQYVCLHHKLIASALAVKLGHEINPQFQIGCMIGGICQYPYSCHPKDMILSTTSRQKTFFFVSDIQVRGYYPSYTKRIFKELGINLEISEEDQTILKEGKVDFYSFSYYSTGCVTTLKDKAATGGNLVFGTANPYLETSQWGWQIDPTGLRYFLNEIYDRYQIPIMVVENGLGQDDIIDENHEIHDDYRIAYMKAHLEAMSEALEDGVDLIAYTPWGIIDLVAASTGEMKKRYGVIYVDANDKQEGTYQRYKKDSYDWYQSFIKENKD